MGDKAYRALFGLAPVEIPGELGQPEYVHDARGFNIGGIAPVVVEHQPVGIAESRTVQVVIMRLLENICLLQHASVAITSQLS